jgi:hypothetical protein
MPLYDCGAPDCAECQRAHGPDRTKAVAEYRRRLEWFETLNKPAEKQEAA